MSIIPESFLDILQSTTLAHVATIGPKGEPQVSPVLFTWDGTHILFSMNKVRQRHRNLQREPRIALSLIDPTNPYRSIEIRGIVARIDEDVNYRFINAQSQRYFKQDATLLPGEERVVIVVEPERAIVFPLPEDKK